MCSAVYHQGLFSSSQPAPGFLQPPVGTAVAPAGVPPVPAPAAVPVAEPGYLTADGVSRTLAELQVAKWTPQQIATLARG